MMARCVILCCSKYLGLEGRVRLRGDKGYGVRVRGDKG
jgi:hypothetical protein